MAIRCAHCSRWLTPEEAGQPCPRCGSMDRKVFAQDQAVADEKAGVAKELANKHYQAEAGLSRIFRLTGKREVEGGEAREPIKLLECERQHRSVRGAARARRSSSRQRDTVSFRDSGGFAGGVSADSDAGTEAAKGLAARGGDAQAAGRHGGGLMATPAEWARGYARQADADFQSWQAIESNEAVPSISPHAVSTNGMRKAEQEEPLKFMPEPRRSRCKRATAMLPIRCRSLFARNSSSWDRIYEQRPASLILRGTWQPRLR